MEPVVKNSPAKLAEGRWREKNFKKRKSKRLKLSRKARKSEQATGYPTRKKKFWAEKNREVSRQEKTTEWALGSRRER